MERDTYVSNNGQSVQSSQCLGDEWAVPFFTQSDLCIRLAGLRWGYVPIANLVALIAGAGGLGLNALWRYPA